MRIFFAVLGQEFLISYRRFGKVLASFLFFLIFISIFLLLAQDQQNQALKPDAMILISLVFCLIFSAGEFLKKDFDEGRIEQFLISCENFEIFVLAKMLANWLICCVPIIIASFVLKPNLEFLALIFLASLSINFICCFCGSLSVAGNSAPLIAAIALPLIIPTLLLCLGDFQTSSKILAGIAVLLGATLSFSTAKIIKISAE